MGRQRIPQNLAEPVPSTSDAKSERPKRNRRKVAIQVEEDEQDVEIVKKKQPKNQAGSKNPPSANEPVPNKMSDDPEIRKKQCDQCFAIFSTAEKLRRHLLSHSDEGESLCKFCNKVIKYKYNLKTHILKCSEKSKKNVGVSISQFYPDFFRQLELATHNPLLEMPSLPPQWTMDKCGFVTGFDPNLPVDLSMMSRTKEESRNLGKKWSDLPSVRYKMAPKNQRNADFETIDDNVELSDYETYIVGN